MINHPNRDEKLIAAHMAGHKDARARREMDVTPFLACDGLIEGYTDAYYLELELMAEDDNGEW